MPAAGGRRRPGKYPSPSRPPSWIGTPRPCRTRRLRRPAGPRLRDRDLLDAIAGARVVLSINAYNDVPLYHSDRLVHALAAGAFVLAKRIPRGDLLFEDGVHYRTFATPDEIADFVERCLAD
ncbi:MAG TPA: glycosyltransferase, partial [Thiobacillaceae bacterium]|nr:glycosyltransferase [Thiobacillaceae bacterium]